MKKHIIYFVKDKDGATEWKSVTDVGDVTLIVIEDFEIPQDIDTLLLTVNNLIKKSCSRKNTIPAIQTEDKQGIRLPDNEDGRRNLMGVSVHLLGLNPGVMMFFASRRWHTLGDLLSLSEEKLRKTRNFGKKSLVKFLEGWVTPYGLSLEMDVDHYIKTGEVVKKQS